MAEVLPNHDEQKAGVSKKKKQPLRVDLTPMVDLGFLLISFFVFTTTITQPTAMKLAMPDDRNVIDSSEIAADKTLNLILGNEDIVYAYNGAQLNDIKNIGSNTAAMRNTILQKKNEVRKKYGNDSDLIVLIKPTNASTYSNVINALDEMLICNIKTYVLMDARDDELKATSR